MICKNCDYTVQGTFCSQCGQKASVSKITLTNLLDQLSNSIFQVDKGFFYTMKQLFTRPGLSIREYLDGKRKRHFKPIAYLLTLSTLYLLITQLCGQNTLLQEALAGSAQGFLDIKEQDALPTGLLWFSKNYAYATLLLLPIFSLASYISFLGLGANYLEHFVLNSFTTGQQAIFYSVFAVLGSFIKSEVVEIIPLIIAICYNFWVFYQFFRTRNLAGVVLRSILTYILYFILCSVIYIPIIALVESVG